jgi:hypothetical protein
VTTSHGPVHGARRHLAAALPQYRAVAGVRDLMMALFRAAETAQDNAGDPAED